MPVFGIQPAGLLQSIFEDIGTAVAVIDYEERVVFANRTALALFGVPALNGRLMFQEWRQNYRFENSLGHEISMDDSGVIRALKGERVEAQELRVTLPDGTTKWIVAWAYPFSVAGLGGVLAIIVDETMEVQLRRLTSQLQRMETMGALAAGLTHDFNNILDTISLNADLAIHEATQEQDCRARLEQISAATKKAASLISRLLKFSSTQELHVQKLQINDVVHDALQLLHPLFRKHILVRTNLLDGLPPVPADRSQMEQVLINLVVNALDAMPESGELTISTMAGNPEEVTRPNSTESFITIIVSDTGCGIAPELQSAIFEPFFTTKPVGKGTGLGLSTVSGIVRQHHGTISVRSTVGTGTAFIVSLPMRQATPVKNATEPSSDKVVVLPVRADR